LSCQENTRPVSRLEEPILEVDENTVSSFEKELTNSRTVLTLPEVASSMAGTRIFDTESPRDAAPPPGHYAALFRNLPSGRPPVLRRRLSEHPGSNPEGKENRKGHEEGFKLLKRGVPSSKEKVVNSVRRVASMGVGLPEKPKDKEATPSDYKNRIFSFFREKSQNAPVGRRAPKIEISTQKRLQSQNKKFSLADEYEIGPLIGEGGSCVVRKITSKVDGCCYALKTFKDSLNTPYGSIESFLLKRLDHPGIIKLKKAFKSRGNV
jgi:hypothetical protein